MREKLESEMIDKPTSNAQHYEIRLKGHLNTRWRNQFEGMTIRLEEDGCTLLTGPVPDQAALHGLLKKVRDLGTPLVSVVQVQSSRSKIGDKMNISTTPAKKIDPKALLSTLWIVVMINMLKADTLPLYTPSSMDEVVKTAASTGASIPQLMLGGAIMGELAIAMIILSRVLKYRINRLVNIVMGIITIAYIWGLSASYPHYLFIAGVETICLLLIIWYAWKWHNIEV